jgi:NADH oxidase (H2O2-forming)
MDENIKTDVLVVGGGPGGRVSYMVLKQFGVGQVKMVANEEPTVICSLPYGVGRKRVPAGPEAVVVDLSKSHRLPPTILQDVLQGNVTRLDLKRREAIVEGSRGKQAVTFEHLVLAPGAVPWIPPVEGVLKEEGPAAGTGVMHGNRWVDKGRLSENVYVLRGASDARQLDALADRAKSAVVVGTGAIGLETAEALVDRGMRVTLVEALPHVVAALDEDMAVLIEGRLAERNVKVFKGAGVDRVLPEGLKLADGTVLQADGIVFATGVRPDLRLAKQAGLVTEKGIVVDGRMKTSDSRVYAVGDAVQVKDGATGEEILPLIGTLAMRQAMVAAANIAGRPMELPPLAAWGVSEIFGLHWGSVGWTEEAARKAHFPVASLVQPVRTRDPFMPEGREGAWKLVVATAPHGGVKPGQILGFQVVQDGDSPLFLAERFIDIVSRGETVLDLFGHYFIHSPAHNAVDDPYLGLVNQAMRMFGQ